MANRPVAMIVATNMRRWRLSRYWSQAHLGELIGTRLGRPWSRSTMSVAEQGGRLFTVDEAAQIADIFGKTVAEIVTPSPPCPRCLDNPPTGMKCLDCGTEGSLIARAGLR